MRRRGKHASGTATAGDDLPGTSEGVRSIRWMWPVAAVVGGLVLVSAGRGASLLASMYRRVSGAGAVALASGRPPPCRITLGRADSNRFSQAVPCVITRAGRVAVQNLPPSPALLAELEERGDFQAIAAAYLHDGDVVSAELFLGRARPSATLDSDRAAIALERGAFAEALRLADTVLAREPRSPSARWNRAVALERLGRRREAADQFRAIAASTEAGWADQARRRAVQLDRVDP